MRTLLLKTPSKAGGRLHVHGIKEDLFIAGSTPGGEKVPLNLPGTRTEQLCKYLGRGLRGTNIFICLNICHK